MIIRKCPFGSRHRGGHLPRPQPSCSTAQFEKISQSQYCLDFRTNRTLMPRDDRFHGLKATAKSHSKDLNPR